MAPDERISMLCAQLLRTKNPEAIQMVADALSHLHQHAHSWLMENGPHVLSRRQETIAEGEKKEQKDLTSMAWLRVEDPSLEIWAWHIVKKAEDATVLSSAGAQQLAREANDKSQGYVWASVPLFGPTVCCPRD